MDSNSARGHYSQGAQPTVINRILFLIAYYIIHIDFNPVASAESEELAVMYHQHGSQGFLMSSGLLC